MAKHWEELGRKREGDTALEAEIEDVGGHEWDMCEEVSLEEVLKVMKKRGMALDPDRIMNEMLMYEENVGGGDVADDEYGDEE